MVQGSAVAARVGVAVRDGSGREPHVPVGRLADGMWVFAPFGAVFVVAGGARVVCHACGDALAAVSAQHARRHGLTLAGYRERFGLNRKQSLIAPALAEVRREEGRRRWAQNADVRDGLAVGQEMARSGELYEIGSRRSRQGPVDRRAGQLPHGKARPRPCEQTARTARPGRAPAGARAKAMGFTELEAYLDARRADGLSAHRVWVELGCGGRTADRLLAGN